MKLTVQSFAATEKEDDLIRIWVHFCDRSHLGFDGYEIIEGTFFVELVGEKDLFAAHVHPMTRIGMVN